MGDATGFDTRRRIKGTCFNGVIDFITGDLLPDVVAALMNHREEARPRRRVSEFGAFHVKRASALKAKPVRPVQAACVSRPSCRESRAGSKLSQLPNAAPKSRAMFTKAGIAELHGAMHERLDLLLGHVAAVPDDLHHKPIPGFGHPSIWKQLVHILTCEDGWVHDLQDKTSAGWHEKDCPTMTAMLAAKARISEATRTYLNNLSEEQLNATLAERPVEWAGELRSPAFILLHVITHAFHHKGQIVAMLRILGYPAPDTDLQQV